MICGVNDGHEFQFCSQIRGQIYFMCSLSARCVAWLLLSDYVVTYFLFCHVALDGTLSCLFDFSRCISVFCEYLHVCL